MHCCLLDMGRQFLNLYFNRLNSGEYEYLYSLMQKMRLPNQCSKFPRSLKDRCRWKAKEYKNFILFHSIPLLSLVFNNKIVKHWNLIMQSLFILLNEKISKTELREANKNLYKFVYEAQDFKVRVMTYNVYQLLYLADSVKNWEQERRCFKFNEWSKRSDSSSIRNVNMVHSIIL